LIRHCRNRAAKTEKSPAAIGPPGGVCNTAAKRAGELWYSGSLLPALLVIFSELISFQKRRLSRGSRFGRRHHTAVSATPLLRARRAEVSPQEQQPRSDRVAAAFNVWNRASGRMRNLVQAMMCARLRRVEGLLDGAKNVRPARRRSPSAGRAPRRFI
jgi:hypothetical protein